MRIPEHRVFLFPGRASFSACICISICDFKASFSCPGSEAEGNICSDHRRVVLPGPGCRCHGGALQERVPAAQPRGCVRLPGRSAPRKPGSQSEMGIARGTALPRHTEGSGGGGRRRGREQGQERARRHEALVDPTPPDLLTWSLGTKELLSAGPEHPLAKKVW